MTVSLEEHKQLVQEKEELAEQVKEMEKRLEELKLKNNVRRNIHTLRYNMELGPSLFCRPCVTTAGRQGTMLPPWRRPPIRSSSRHTERQRWVVRTRVCVCIVLSSPFPLPFQQRCKAARAEALTEARDAQKVLPLKPPSPEYALDFSFPPPHSLSFSSCFQMSAWVKRRMFLAPPGWTCLRRRLRSTWST